MLAERFEALLTVDQNLEFQQNLRASGVGVVLVTRSDESLEGASPSRPCHAQRHSGRHSRGDNQGWWLTGDSPPPSTSAIAAMVCQLRVITGTPNTRSNALK